MDIYPHSLAGWLRYGLVSSLTACLGLLNYCNALTKIPWPYYLDLRRATLAFFVSLAVLFVVSLILLPLNRRLALLGIVSSVLLIGIFPLATIIKER